MQFVRVAQGWPGGTKDAAELLERLGVPINASKRTARDTLKTEGERMRDGLLQAAIRFRREASDHPHGGASQGRHLSESTEGRSGHLRTNGAPGGTVRHPAAPVGYSPDSQPGP